MLIKCALLVVCLGPLNSESFHENQPHAELEGWRKISPNQNPVSPGRYLFAYQEGVYALNLTNPLDLDSVAKVESMTISFEYFTHFTEERFGNPLIQIKTRACWFFEDKITTSDIKEHLLNPNVDGWYRKSYNTEDAQYPDFQNRDDCFSMVGLEVTIGDTEGNFVAIRDFTVEYTYIPLSPQEHISGDDGQVTDLPAVTIQKKCDTPTNCDEIFANSGTDKFLWSRQGLPQTTGAFWIAAAYGEPFLIQFKNITEKTEAIMKLRLWISDHSHLELRDEAAVDKMITLAKTTANDGVTLDWMPLEIKLSDLKPIHHEPFAYVLLTPFIHEFDKGVDNIALQVVDIVFLEVPRLQEQAPEYFVSWENYESQIEKFWHVLPQNRFTPHLQENPADLTFTPPMNLGVSQIYSDWFVMSYSTESTLLKFQVDPIGDVKNLSVTVKVLAANMSVVAAASEVRGYHNLTLPGQEGDLRRIVFEFLHLTDPSGQLKVSRVSVADGCDPSPCNRGTCLNAEGNLFRCACNQEAFGDRCQYENFCETLVYAVPGRIYRITGLELCRQGGATTCISHLSRRDDNLPFDCICESDDAFCDPTVNRCVPISDCMRVFKCPNKWTKCLNNEELALDGKTFDIENPCPVCLEGFKRVGDTLDCEPEDPCEKCGSAKCRVMRAHELDSHYPAVNGICYCPVGFSEVHVGSNSFTCKPINPTCPEIERTASGCDHGCEWRWNEYVRDVDVKCTCRRGFELEEDGKTCTQIEDVKCTPVCEENEICVGTKNSASCQCAPGYFVDEAGKCNIDFCTKAETNVDLQLMITQTCGIGITNCFQLQPKKFVCHCDPDRGLQLNEHTGRCQLIDPCDSDDFKNKCKDDGNQRCWRRAISQHSVAGFKPIAVCKCLPGEQYNDATKKCEPQCDIRENVIECAAHNKECMVNYRGRTKQCVCRPGFNLKAVRSSETARPSSWECRLSGYAYKIVNLKFSINSQAYLAIQGPLLIRNVGAESSEFVERRDDPVQMFATVCRQSPDPDHCLKYAEVLLQQDAFDPNVLKQKEEELVLQEVKKAFNVVLKGSKGFDLDGFSFIGEVRGLSDPEQKNEYEATIAMTFTEQVDDDWPLKKIAERCLYKKSVVSGYCALPFGLNIDIESMGEVNEEMTQLTSVKNTHVFIPSDANNDNRELFD